MCGTKSLKLFTRLLLLLAWGLCLLWLSLTPAPPQPPGIFGWDKLQHVAAIGVLSLLAGWSLATLPRISCRAWGIAAIFSIAFGGLIEILQWAFTDSRSAEIGDILADATGAGIVYLLTKAVDFNNAGGKS